MIPFVIFVIVLTVAYILYYGVTITNDLYGKIKQVKTNEDFFDVSSMNEPNRCIFITALSSLATDKMPKAAASQFASH